MGLTPFTKRSSYIDIKLRSKTSDLNMGVGSIILSSVSNSNIEFYYNNTDVNQILSNTSSTFRFRQGKKASSINYNIDTENNYRIYLPHKWNIDYDNLVIISGGQTWTRLDSDIDINYIRTNYYYTLDLSDEQGLVIEFLGNLIGQPFSGTVTVDYYLCDGLDGNGLLDTDLKIKSTTTGLNTSQFEIVYSKNKSLNGLNETSVTQIQKLASSYFKNNNRIVTRENLDIYNWSIWTKEISNFDWHYDSIEECYILQGEVEVTTLQGTKTRFGKGDFVTFPKDLDCTWNIIQPVRKHYRFV
jgi:uncharacterized cupin superfamily protein